jgi:hypothetical protein
VKAIDTGLWELAITVQNSGWLPSYVTRLALDKKLVRGVIFDIDLPDGAELVHGERRVVGGQLEGRAYKPSSTTGWAGQACDTTDERIRVSWIIAADNDTEVAISAHHERAGKLETTLKMRSEG